MCYNGFDCPNSRAGQEKPNSEKTGKDCRKEEKQHKSIIDSNSGGENCSVPSNRRLDRQKFKGAQRMLAKDKKAARALQYVLPVVNLPVPSNEETLGTTEAKKVLYTSDTSIKNWIANGKLQGGWIRLGSKDQYWTTAQYCEEYKARQELYAQAMKELVESGEAYKRTPAEVLHVQKVLQTAREDTSLAAADKAIIVKALKRYERNALKATAAK